MQEKNTCGKNHDYLFVVFTSFALKAVNFNQATNTAHNSFWYSRVLLNPFMGQAFSSQMYILTFYLPARTRLFVLVLCCFYPQGMSRKMLTDEDTQ